MRGKLINKLGYGFMVAVYSVGLVSANFIGVAQASINSCTANMSPIAVQPNSQTSFTISLTNNGPGAIEWIQVQRPSTNYVITNAVWSGSSSVGDAQATMYGGAPIAASSTSSFGLVVHAGEDQSSGDSWTVLVSDNADGSAATSCSGSLTSAVSGVRIADPDTTPPVISNLKLSKLASSSLTISWTTDEPANSDVAYGETIDYGSNKHDAAFVTSHIVNLTNLTPDSSYHFYVTSYDQSGIGVSTEDNTFLTPEASTPTAQTPVATTIAISKVPTEKIPPTVQIDANLSKPFKTAPRINGTAGDNVALAVIDYSVDEGRNWLPVDTVSGLGGKKASFSFTPQNLKDGDYVLMVRATDTSGNQATTPSQTLIIDLLPPIVGGGVITVGAQVVQPDDKGVLSALTGLEQKITLSAVGGPTSIVVVKTLPGNKDILQSFNLARSTENGLWSGTVSYSTTGLYELSIDSVDGAGNQTSRSFGLVNVLSPGKITNTSSKGVDAKVTVYCVDPDTGGWVIWDGDSYDQPNPISSSAKSGYGIYLPAGAYYLKVTAKGQRSVITNSFTINKPEIINQNFQLSVNPGIDAGWLHIHLLWPQLVASNLAGTNPIKGTSSQSVIGQSLPQFRLQQTNGRTLATANLYGKPTVISMVNTWSGLSSGQIDGLKDLDTAYVNVVALSSGESLPRLNSFVEQAGYNLPVTADVNNQLTDFLKVSLVPATYFIDRHGVVKKVMCGVLSKQELISNVEL